MQKKERGERKASKGGREERATHQQDIKERNVKDCRRTGGRAAKRRQKGKKKPWEETKKYPR